jgi:inorganic pyrophosphatase
MIYPGNYGFIPHTMAGDNDPLDALLVTEFALHPMTIVRARIIGALHMEDEKGIDDKLIIVPHSSVDPSNNHINNIDDLSPHVLNKVEHFFTFYKNNEPDKWVKVYGFVDKDKALDMYKKSLTNRATYPLSAL